jgi:hypothetical protein
MSYPEFGHIGFKILCSVFMLRTIVHYTYSEEYMRDKFQHQKRLTDQMEQTMEKMNKRKMA